MPTFNPALENTFGVRNDQSPNSIAISPRLGFNWYYKTRGPQTSMNVSQYSSIIRGGPSIRGGIGEFRNFLRSDLLADAIGSTGLPGSTQRLVCTGPAAPIPDWQAYMNDPSSIPTTCAGRSISVRRHRRERHARRSSRIADARVARDARVDEHGQGNYLAIDGMYSLNLNQPGIVDLNFAGTPHFTLAQ